MPTLQHEFDQMENHSAEPDALANMVIKRFKDAQRARRTFERQWYTNLAMLEGRQWPRWNPSLTQLEERPAPKWRDHATYNLIQPAVRIAMSKLVKNQPVTECLPGASEEPDRDSAMIGNKLVKYWQRRSWWKRKINSVLSWTCSMGIGFLKVGWDPEAGRMFTARPLNPSTNLMTGVIDTNKPKRPSRWTTRTLADAVFGTGQFAQATEAVDQLEETFAEGEIQLEVVNPFKMYADPAAMDWEEVQWIIEAQLVKVEDIRETWGEEAANQTAAAESADAPSSPGFDRRKMGSMSNLAAVSEFFADLAAEEIDHEQDTLPMYEYWERPSRKSPRGRWITVVGNKVVRDEENPYRFNDLPYIPIIFEMTPGRLWSRGIVESLIPCQRNFNAFLSRIFNSIALTANPKYAVSRMAGLDPTALDSEPGEVVLVDHQFYPQPLQPPSMPAYVMNVVQYITNVMQEISAQHEVSKAQVPPNVEAGIAIQMLKEADDTQLAPTFQMLDESLVQTTLYMLMIAQRYYEEPRTIHVVGANRRPEVVTFTGADLMNIADVSVVTSSGVPQTLAGRKQELLSYYQAGVFGAPGSPAASIKFLRASQYGELEELFEEPTAEELMEDILKIFLEHAKQDPMMLMQFLQGGQGGQPPVGPPTGQPQLPPAPNAGPAIMG